VDAASVGPRLCYWQYPRRATNFPILTAIYEPSAAAPATTKCNFIGATATSGRFMQIDVRSFARRQIWDGGKEAATATEADLGAAADGDMHAMQFQLSYVDSFVRHSTHVAGSMRHRNQSDDDDRGTVRSAAAAAAAAARKYLSSDSGGGGGVRLTCLTSPLSD